VSILRGEDLNIGIGLEGSGGRGVLVDPQAFVPGRTPTGVMLEVKKALLKETRASGVASQGSEVVAKQVVGNLEFNLKSETIGYLLKSLLGKLTTTTSEGTAKKHLFELAVCDPQFPTLSLALSQCGAFQDYGYNGVLVKSLEIKTPVDDLVNATAEFVGMDEAEQTAVSVAFEDTDYSFRPGDVSIKIADDVAGLSSAVAVDAREFSILINNNARSQFALGSVAPTDSIAGLLDVSGELTLDYENSDYHDIYVAGSYKAVQIIMERADITIGTTKHPKLTITLPKVSIEKNEQDRPLDDLVKDKLSFVAHYDTDEAQAIKVELINEIAEYEAEAIS
jgi:hypothetical protein